MIHEGQWFGKLNGISIGDCYLSWTLIPIYACWYTTNIDIISAFNALSNSSSSLVAAVLLQVIRRGRYHLSLHSNLMKSSFSLPIHHTHNMIILYLVVCLKLVSFKRRRLSRIILYINIDIGDSWGPPEDWLYTYHTHLHCSIDKI